MVGCWGSEMGVVIVFGDDPISSLDNRFLAALAPPYLPWLYADTRKKMLVLVQLS